MPSRDIALLFATRSVRMFGYGLLAVVVSCWLLYRELRGMSLDDVWDSLTAVPSHRYALAAFLEVEHELHRDAGLARPLRVRRVAAVADEVARVVGVSHSQLPR